MFTLTVIKVDKNATKHRKKISCSGCNSFGYRLNKNFPIAWFKTKFMPARNPNNIPFHRSSLVLSYCSTSYSLLKGI